MELKDKLNFLKENIGLNTKVIAERVGISPYTIYKYLEGKRGLTDNNRELLEDYLDKQLRFLIDKIVKESVGVSEEQILAHLEEEGDLITTKLKDLRLTSFNTKACTVEELEDLILTIDREMESLLDRAESINIKAFDGVSYYEPYKATLRKKSLLTLVEMYQSKSNFILEQKIEACKENPEVYKERVGGGKI